MFSSMSVKGKFLAAITLALLVPAIGAFDLLTGRTITDTQSGKTRS